MPEDCWAGLLLQVKEKGVVVLIEGDCIDSIYCKLDTWDEDQLVADTFKERIHVPLLY